MERTSTAIVCSVSYIDTRQKAAIDAASCGEFELSLTILRQLLLKYPNLSYGVRSHKEILQDINRAMHAFLENNFTKLFKSLSFSTLHITRRIVTCELKVSALLQILQEYQEDFAVHMNDTVFVATMNMYTDLMCSHEGEITEEFLINLLGILKQA